MQTHSLRNCVAKLKTDAIYALYPESFCDKNLAIRKVFAFCDSVLALRSRPLGLAGRNYDDEYDDGDGDDGDLK